MKMKTCFIVQFSLFFVLLSTSLSSVLALPPRNRHLSFILGEDNFGRWKNGISTVTAEAPGPANVGTLVLAERRTKRPDILSGFRRYRGGWDIANKHYWASVGFTGATGFSLAIVWFISFGLALVVHHCCGWRVTIKTKESSYSQGICLFILVILTCAAAIGCILLSVGQDEFHDEALSTLNYVVNQSDYTVQTLRNVTQYLSLAETVNVAQVFLPSDAIDSINKLNVELISAADTLEQKTRENSSKIKRVFNSVRSALITVAAVMLLLSILGLCLSVLGHQHAIHIFIISGWILVAVTFILCGVFVILNNAISDTCVAMGEWVDNPHAETALSNILPCVDQETTNQTLYQSKQVTNDIVNIVNRFVDTFANSNLSPQRNQFPNYYNQSGPPVPHLCYPYDSQLHEQGCSSQEISMENASLAWESYVCMVSESGICSSIGRLTPEMYDQLVAAVNISYALEHYTPPLLSLQDCNFVRDAFRNIVSDYCPQLKEHLRVLNAGLALVSVGVMLSLALWMLYANCLQRMPERASLSSQIKSYCKGAKRLRTDQPLTSPSPPTPSPASSNAAPLGHSVIPTINRLQDIFAQLGSSSTIELPQVAVVGSQSSGKSSVLEALVGRDFLPRGSDICTRRPLVLQLLQTKRKADGTEEEYGEFLHLPGKRFFNFNDIRNEIQAETDREAGGNKGVSDKQIRLKIFSPNVLDITLVDLPGITKVPVGDQPSDIEARIRTMIMSYIKLPSCLILAVTPANADLANSDALQIAGNADPDGYRTIGVITKLDIMDRGTDARNFLLGKVIPLRLGYIGVVNRCQEDIMKNLTIKEALAREEKFFRSHPVYNDIADRCGVPQLAKKLNQILVQHIMSLLPGLKKRVGTELVSVAKELNSYGEITESKAGQGALLLNILSKYSEAFSSMIEGKNEEMSTSELSGGARIHYIFQSIFVKSLEEVDPCEDLSDEDIRTAIQNATGPRSALFVPEVPFEVLIRRQIARLLDPSLQCARFIYDELIKMSHQCMLNELQRFPVLRKRMDEVVGNFLREGLEPSETMIGHIVEMEMDYINTSHPNFVGGSKAVEIAQQQIRSSRIAAPISRPKDVVESEKGSISESLKSRAILARPTTNGIVQDQGVRPAAEMEKATPSGNTSSSSWGLPSIFGGSDNRRSGKENSANRSYIEPVPSMEHALSIIHLREPPTVLRPSETHSDEGSLEIAVTKLLLRSYYDIVRKNIEDSIPKAIMHFLVNHTKRELHNVFIKRLYRDNLLEEMLQEPNEVASKRKRAREKLRVLQQAFRTLDELPLEAEMVERGYSSNSSDPTGLPKIHGLPTSSIYSTSSGSADSYTASPKNQKSRKSSHSGELYSSSYTNTDSNGGGRNSNYAPYPTVDAYPI